MRVNPQWAFPFGRGDYTTDTTFASSVFLDQADIVTNHLFDIPHLFNSIPHVNSLANGDVWLLYVVQPMTKAPFTRGFFILKKIFHITQTLNLKNLLHAQPVLGKPFRLSLSKLLIQQLNSVCFIFKSFAQAFYYQGSHAQLPTLSQIDNFFAIQAVQYPTSMLPLQRLFL